MRSLKKISEEEFESLPEYEPGEREREARMLLKVDGEDIEVDIEMLKKYEKVEN